MRLSAYMEMEELGLLEMGRRANVHHASLLRVMRGEGGLAASSALRVIQATNGLVTLEDLVAEGAGQ